MQNFKRKRIDDAKYRKWISSLLCVVTLRPDVQCAHLRSGNGSGMGHKSGDNFCLPLSCELHAKQHEKGSEQEFWKEYGGYEEAVKLANDLYNMRYDTERSMMRIVIWRRLWDTKQN
jgi:hypothetical protein